MARVPWSHACWPDEHSDFDLRIAAAKDLSRAREGHAQQSVRIADQGQSARKTERNKHGGHHHHQHGQATVDLSELSKEDRKRVRARMRMEAQLRRLYFGMIIVLASASCLLWICFKRPPKKLKFVAV